MKELVINKSLNLIKSHHPEYSNERLEIIEYGLVGLYLTITKTIVIIIAAILLGVLKELIILTIFYNIIRMPSFGMHASSSLLCLLSSSIMFLGGAYLSSFIFLPVNIKIIIGIICVILLFKNSPADTEKRPIINSKRRFIYKMLSTIIAILYLILSLIISDNMIANCILIALIFQAIMTSPLTYKIFKQPYNNYLNYH